MKPRTNEKNGSRKGSTSGKRTSVLKLRYGAAKSALWKNMQKVTDKDHRRVLEEDACYLQREVDSYGFEFFDNHYVRDAVIALEELAKTTLAEVSTK